MPYTNQKTGETISDEEYNARFGTQNNIQQNISQNAEKPKINFLERLKLGFGGSEAKAKQQQLEQEAGLKGKLDIGDIADVAGASLPIIGGAIGAIPAAAATLGLGAVGGGAVGAAGGEAIRRGIGVAVGADQPTVGEVAGDVALTGAGSFVGGKVLGGLFNAVAKALPKTLVSTIFKQSADDIGRYVKSGGKNLTQAEEVLEEGFRGSPQKMMTQAWQSMKNLEQEARALAKNSTIQIDNKKGYISLITDYVKNLNKTSFGFENEIAKEGQNIVSQLKTIKGDVIPGELALSTRRFIDGVRRTASFKVNPNLSPKESAYKKAADALRSNLSQSIPGFEDVMNRYSININAFDDLASYAAKSQNRELFDLIDVFIMYGIDPTAYLARKGITSATAKTGVAQGLYQGGKLLEKFMPKGATSAATTRGAIGIYDRLKQSN